MTTLYEFPFYCVGHGVCSCPRIDYFNAESLAEADYLATKHGWVEGLVFDKVTEEYEQRWRCPWCARKI